MPLATMIAATHPVIVSIILTIAFSNGVTKTIVLFPYVAMRLARAAILKF